jgi:hypothetical protein
MTARASFAWLASVGEYRASTSSPRAPPPVQLHSAGHDQYQVRPPGLDELPPQEHPRLEHRE